MCVWAGACTAIEFVRVSVVLLGWFIKIAAGAGFQSFLFCLALKRAEGYSSRPSGNLGKVSYASLLTPASRQPCGLVSITVREGNTIDKGHPLVGCLSLSLCHRRRSD